MGFCSYWASNELGPIKTRLVSLHIYKIKYNQLISLNHKIFLICNAKRVLLIFQSKLQKKLFVYLTNCEGHWTVNETDQTSGGSK